MVALQMLLLRLQSHLARAPYLTATSSPSSEDLQQQHLWKQCNKVATKTTLRETMQAIGLGVVSHLYQPLPLLDIPSPHPFMVYCLLHQDFRKGRPFQTKRLTGLLMSIHTQWRMTARVRITPNCQLFSSCLECRTHSVATNCADLTVVKLCWHRSHHC